MIHSGSLTDQNASSHSMSGTQAAVRSPAQNEQDRRWEIVEEAIAGGTRLVLPYRKLNSAGLWQSQARWQPLAVLGVGLLVSTVAAWFVYINLNSTFWLAFVYVTILLAFVAVSTHKWRSYTYLGSGRTRSFVEIGNQFLRVYEDRGTRFWTTNSSAVSICRLRVLEMPLGRFEFAHFHNPTDWAWLNRTEPHFTLVAESEFGWILYPIAISYPKSVMIDLGKRVKRLLDQERESYVRELQELYPQTPITWNEKVPFCIGLTKPAILADPRQPDRTKIKMSRRGRTVTFIVPRAENLEEVHIIASPEGIRVKRDLLLGRKEICILASNLTDVRVVDSDMLSQEDHLISFSKLLLDYVDENRRRTSLSLLQDQSFAEICWIADQIKRACPPMDAVPVVAPSPFRFSIAQIMFGTFLCAIISAGFVVNVYWGWLYAITSVSLTFCIASFTGFNCFGWITNRSWTKLEIYIAAFFLSFFWLMRLIAYLVET